MSSLLKKASFVLIPSGYKSGKLYAEIPKTGNGDLTWSRNSLATRTNSSGQIEEMAYNLLLRTEEFENSSWIKTATSIVSNDAISPNGTITADLYSSNGTSTIHRLYSSFSSIVGSVYTMSVYVKKSTNDFFQIWIQAGGAFPANICYANYNISNGTLGTVGSGATAFIESVGNGWYRCYFSSLATATANSNLNFTLITADNAPIAQSNSLSTSVYIWGAQVVVGTEPKTYLPVSDTRNNFPRLSYMYGSCPALLLEPQRTNLLLYSEDLTNGWSVEGLTITSNSTNAPDANLTADTIQETAITDVHRIYRASIAITSGANYAFSFYVKKDTQRYVRLVLNQPTNSAIWVAVQFDLDTQTFTSGVGSGGGTFVSASITSASNGFYRITLVGSIASTSAFAFLALSNGTAISSSDSRGCNVYLGSTSNRIWAWGGQFEQGSYATTYIPTTSATATRIADAFTRNNIYTNGLISASGGTWFVEFKNNINYIRDNANRFGITDNTTTFANAILILPTPTSRLSIVKFVGGNFSTVYNTANDNIKIAIKWNGSTADVFANGVKVVSATTFTATLMEFFHYQGSASVGTPVFIQQMALFNTPLSDAECIQMTS